MMAMDFQIMANLFNVWAQKALSIAISTLNVCMDGQQLARSKSIQFLLNYYLIGLVPKI